LTERGINGYHDLASRLTLRDRRSASAARIPADLIGNLRPSV